MVVRHAANRVPLCVRAVDPHRRERLLSAQWITNNLAGRCSDGVRPDFDGCPYGFGALKELR